MAPVSESLGLINSLFHAIDNKTLYSETGGIPDDVYQYIDKNDDTLSKKLRHIIQSNRLNNYGETPQKVGTPMTSAVH